MRLLQVAVVAALLACVMGAARADINLNGKLGLGVTYAKDNLMPAATYDLISTHVNVLPGAFKATGTQSVNLGIFVAESGERWDRVDFGPQVNYTYNRFYAGIGFHPSTNRAMAMFGFKF